MSRTKFEPGKLSISLAGQGFVLGLSSLGDPLGESSPYHVDVTDQLTKLEVTHGRRVDDNLFISPEASTLTMSAKYENAPAVFKGYTIVVQYAGQGELFRGRVTSADRSVAFDPNVPGYRRWTVALTASTGDDRAAGYEIRAPEASQAPVAEAILERVPYVNDVYVHPDLDLDDVEIAAGHDEKMTVRELFDRVSRICSCLVISDPSSMARVMLLPYDYGAAWTLRDDVHPSFRGAGFSEALDAATSVTVSPAHVPEGEETFTASHSLPAAVRNDKSFTLDVPFQQPALAAALARMPVRRSQPEYLKSVELPFDSSLGAEPPTRLVLWLDGRRWESAVTQVKHAITAGAKSWQISLECAPLQLLTRESDT